MGTGKKLEKFEDLLKEVLNGTFTMEDMFYIHMEHKMRVGSKESETWDDNMEMFEYQNYFPGNKNVGEGTWIKIRIKNGYEVHYAKKAKRKRRFNEEIAKKFKRMTSLTKSSIHVLKSGEKSVVNDLKIKILQAEINIMYVYFAIDMKLYEVAIKRTKTKTEYYLPYQYEIVEDLDELTAAVMDSVPGVTVRTRPQGDIEDKVFYLRTRGIPEDLARLMAGLNQTYFMVDIEKMIGIYNKAWRSSVTLKEK
jgi:hypothetical protein